MIDFQDMKVVRKAMKKNTKIVWVETTTNPTLKITDIEACAKITKEFGAILVIDNTFMSPYLVNPLKLGADMVMHSVTKYIGGHSDVLGGALMMNDGDLYDQLMFHIKTLGNWMSAFEAYIALRGAKTLKLRVQQATDSAFEIAKWLETHPKVTKVLYPGLKSHPHYALGQRIKREKHMNGGSGMVCVYLKTDMKGTAKFMSSLKVFTLAESLGGVESLINHPAVMTHASVPKDHRAMLGISDNFVRLSVGIEELEDLKNDIKQALAKF